MYLQIALGAASLCLSPQDKSCAAAPARTDATARRPDSVSDEALLSLNVSRPTNGLDALGTATAIRAAAGYSSSDNQVNDGEFAIGTGFVTQGWEKGLDSRTQSGTSMVAAYNGFGTVTTTGN